MQDKRFTDRLKRMPNGCLEWQGYRDKDGRGFVTRHAISEAPMLAHRYAWYLEHGAMPEGVLLHVVCDNPPCCDIAHLKDGTQADNIADCVSKNRQAFGERNARSKLSKELADEVRKAEGSQSSIAARFGINQSQVSRIRAGKRRSKG